MEKREVTTNSKVVHIIHSTKGWPGMTQEEKLVLIREAGMADWTVEEFEREMGPVEEFSYTKLELGKP